MHVKIAADDNHLTFTSAHTTPPCASRALSLFHLPRREEKVAGEVGDGVDVIGIKVTRRITGRDGSEVDGTYL